MSKILILLYVATTASALIVLKLGSGSGALLQQIGGKIHFNITPLILLGVFLYGTSFLLYTYLISKYDLGYIIPLTTAFVYVLIFVSSFFIFREAFTAIKVLGIALILSGVILLNLNK